MKMLSLLFLLIPAVLCQPNSEEYLYGYTKTPILTVKGLPTNLAYNQHNNDLHFTLIDTENLKNNKVQTKMDQYILRENKTIKIDNINGQAAAVDVYNNRVYIASNDGLYTLDSSNKTQFLSNKGDDIVQLYLTNHLYAVMHPDKDVYIIDVEKNETKKVKNIPYASMLAVDNVENIYYECEHGDIKMLLNGFQESIQIAGIPRNNAKAIAVDGNNRAILATNDGLYRIKPNNVIPVKIMDLDYVPAGLAFDWNMNFFISTNGVIYKYSRFDPYVRYDDPITNLRRAGHLPDQSATDY